MNNKRAVLIAVLAFLLALSVPRSSTAGEIYGTWDGIVTYSFQDFENGQPTYSSSGSYLGVMTLQASESTHELSMYITAVSQPFSGQLLVGGLAPGTFGPNAASGTVVGLIYPGDVYPYSGPFYGNFSITYQSIFPDGQIDTSNGMAVGDIMENYSSPEGNGENSSLYFYSVTIPEPSSMVLAASAILLIGIFERVRRSRPQHLGGSGSGRRCRD